MANFEFFIFLNFTFRHSVVSTIQKLIKNRFSKCYAPHPLLFFQKKIYSKKIFLIKPQHPNLKFQEKVQYLENKICRFDFFCIFAPESWQSGRLRRS